MLLLNHLSEECLNEDIYIDSINCALCKLFSYNDDCEGCPVAIKVNATSYLGRCMDSPYKHVDKWMHSRTSGLQRGFDVGFKVISVELEFLYSLLDE